MSERAAISVNGELQPLAPGSTVASVVEHRNHHRGCAVALNGEVVPRSIWDEVTLSSGDALEILSAAPGG